MSLFLALLDRFANRWPILLYAATWTTLLTATVAVASLAPEVAFVSAISPSSPYSKECGGGGGGGGTGGWVRVPVDSPGEMVCLPANLFARSKVDLLVPPVFAALVVAASAFLVRALGLGEDDGVGR